MDYDWLTETERNMIQNYTAVVYGTGIRLVDPPYPEIRMYIDEHIDEDITPKSVIELFGVPNNTARHRFHFYYGESMPAMIRRLKAERATKSLRGD